MAISSTASTGRAIQRLAAEGLIAAVKLYPAGATTNSASGVRDVERSFTETAAEAKQAIDPEAQRLAEPAPLLGEPGGELAVVGRGDVEDDAVDLRAGVGDTCGDALQDFVRHPRPVGGHGVLTGDRAQDDR